MLKNPIISVFLFCFIHNLFAMKRSREEIIALESVKKQKRLNLHERLNAKKLTVLCIENNDLNVNEVNDHGDSLIISVIKTIDALQDERDEYIFKSQQNNNLDLQSYNARVKELWGIVGAIVDHPTYEPRYYIKRDYYLPHYLVNRAIYCFKQASERKRKVLLFDNDKQKEQLLKVFHKDQEIENNALEKILSHPRCPINAYDKNGETALHLIANRFSYRDIAQNTIKECYGLSPQDSVLQLAGLLLKYSIYADHRAEKSGQSPLHYACKHNDPWMLFLLLQFARFSTLCDEKDRTPASYSGLFRKYIFKKHTFRSVCHNLRINNRALQSKTKAALDEVQSLSEWFHIDLKKIFFR